VSPGILRGRFAPSPTGLIHVGSARTALVSWLSVRKGGGVFIWRLEDLDPPREVPGTADAARRDLAWLGLDWDEGPDLGGPYGPYRQSERSDVYEAALERLAASHDLFPCSHSRKDLLEIASAPHGRGSLPPYPASLRPRDLPVDWFACHQSADASLRFRIRDEPVHWTDRVLGPQTERVNQTTGDFVLKRRDGLYAYQLAVVADDIAMDVTEVVRGADLLDSTARQIQLIEALGGTVPEYAHLPLAINEQGEKLSKRDQGLTLAELREANIRPDMLCGHLAFSLGLVAEPAPTTPVALIDSFAWERIHPEPWIVPDRLPEMLRQTC